MASVAEFAAAIKAKYPQYQGVDDETLARKVVEKHPEYASKVDFGGDNPANHGDLARLITGEKPQPAQGLAADLFPKTAGALADPQAGLGRKALALGSDLATGILRVPAAAADAGASAAGLTSDSPEFGHVATGTTFRSALQNLNQGQNTFGNKTMVDQMANDPATVPTTLIPVGEAAQGAKLGARVLNGAVQGLKLGGASAAIHAGDQYAQTGKVDPSQAVEETLAGGATGGALPALGGLLQGTGQKIINTALKPGLTGAKEGVDIANVFKHGLDKAGSLEGMGQQADKAIDKYNKQAKGAIADVMADHTLPAENKKVDALGLLADTESELQDLAKQGKLGGDQKAIQAAIDHYQGILEHLADDNGQIPLDVANNYKASLQKEAVALYKAANMGLAPDAGIKEQVAAALAGKIRNSLAEKVPGLSEANQAMSELIPIQKAITRREVIANQNQGLGLGHLLSLTGGLGVGEASHSVGAGLAVPLLYEAQRTPAVGGAAYRLGAQLGRPGLQTVRQLGLNPIDQSSPQ